MPNFATPEPISVTLEVGIGDIRIAASDRTDTVVDVRPTDPAKRSDVTAAEQTRVELTGGGLVIEAPKDWRRWTPGSVGGSIDVEISLPAGSRVSGKAGVAALRATGRLGGFHYRAGVGDVVLEYAGPVDVKTGAGDITVEQAVGKTELTTGSGAIGVDRIVGPAAIKNGNGDTWVGEIDGDARVSAGNGGIVIDRSSGTVAAKNANGAVRLGEVSHGSVVAQTAMGAIEVGVREGVATWLDLETRFGSVKNDLDTSDRPGSGEDVIEVHARTSFGNVTVHRASSS